MQFSAPRKSIRWLFGLLAVLILTALAWHYWQGRPQASASAKGQQSATRPGFGSSTVATPVRVAAATREDFAIYYKALGTVTATNTINVRSRVAGELVKVAFEEGQRVKAGDLLAQIDPRSYQIALQQAQGTLLQNQAQLKNARLDLQRYQNLFAKDSIAKQTLDTQQALVSQYEGTLKTDEAAVNDARLNLEFTSIRAPISGRVGLRQLDVGNLVAANDTAALVVVTQVQPITVSFTLPETQLTPVLARYRQGAQLPVQAWDRGDRQLQATGVLASVDNQIDTSTGTLKFKARFDNQDEALFPNQFVSVRLLSDTLKQVVVVPSGAVQFGTNGTYAYVMEGDTKVRIRALEVGASDGVRTVVQAGLAVGDRVVLEGTDRLRDGSDVEVVGPAEPGATDAKAAELQGKPAAQVPGQPNKSAE
ncbi:MdtA/MuxA family multidrug efflux RND transporter periplasmic adaptor subunit [Pseudomonas sp. HR96]|uniref:MdtA/MuxA family multidrug efflux RND transporter periplasmic adaptor subunit n=1 Tax=Pseudomonas sp. HR96 TaxID=1027966 RepID=UPI002A7558A1|nr:MdtA/MuxA family multidrug efflux RND transporter periplasmic adaptor subunit [Pseudomonas sp. HR96]WPP01849.1 MdtA/MuxA family multidrug efflux RND transporter periplasmic adaptor subunit [Pseudomonas sp. HR96]